MPALKGSPLPPAGKPSGLGATFRANEKPILLGAAGLVAVAALWRRHTSTASSGIAGPSSTAATFAGQSTSGGPYDSSGTDVYNALQPQIEQTQNMLSSLFDRLGPGGTIPPAAPAPAPTPSRPVPPLPHVPARIPTPAPPAGHPAPPPRHAPTPGPVQKPATTRYTVRRGDNLTAIANRYKVRGGWSSLYNANRGTVGRNPNLILPGQSLVIPK